MKSNSKLKSFCQTLCMMLLGVLFITGGKTVTVQAASRMVALKADRTYSGYDFTRDGKKDHFKCAADSERGYARIYLNGKFKQRIFIGKGADIYWCSVGTKDNYLLVEKYLYGGHELETYAYSGGKFKNVSGVNGLNKSFVYRDFTKVSGNTLYITSTPGSRNPSSFRNVSQPLTAVTKYTIKNKKISCQSWNAKITGRKTYYAMTSFKTSKSATRLNIKNGPSVKAGQKVTLNYVRFNKTNYVYQITVNGKTGWVENSNSAMFK